MQDIEALFQKMLRGQCSPQEAQRLFDFFSTTEGDAELVRLIERELDGRSDRAETGNSVPFALEENLEKLRAMIQPPKKKPAIYRIWPYAAAVVLILAVGVWLWQGVRWNNHPDIDTLAIMPGGNRATLTLGDGSEVALSEVQDGIRIGDDIRYTDGTEVVGAWVGKQEGGEPAWLSLATPRGGTYQVTLPDGTRVWLNAASVLTYPTHFDGSDRVVELHGEGYFEVAENAQQPFRVMTEQQEVVVLGTIFNVMSYRDEKSVKTTLVEGKVNVSASQHGHPLSVLLLPSEQAYLEGGHLSKQVVDVDTEVAWRHGLFAFRSEPLVDIMRQIARWYDVEVDIAGDIAARTFSGTISRYADINELLETLALTDKVRFEVKERTIVVTPK